MNGRRRNDDAASHTCTCSYARGPRYPVKVAPGKHFDMSQHPVHPWHWMRQCSPRPGPGSYHSCVFSLLHLFYSHSPLFHTHAHAHTHTHTYIQVCAYTRPVHRLTESPVFIAFAPYSSDPVLFNVVLYYPTSKRWLPPATAARPSTSLPSCLLLSLSRSLTPLSTPSPIDQQKDNPCFASLFNFSSFLSSRCTLPK